MTSTEAPKSAPAKAPRKGRFFRRVGRIFLGFFLFLLSLLVALQLPFVQSWLGSLAADWLSNKTGHEVRAEALRIDFLDLAVDLKGLYLGDLHGDTLIFAEHLHAVLGEVQQERRAIVIDEVALEDGGIFLVKYPGESGMNLDTFLARLKPEQPDTLSTTEPWIIEFDKVRLDRASFRLQNPEITGTEAAFQPSDIGLSDISVTVHSFHVRHDTVMMHVDSLVAWDKGGAQLRALNGDFLYCKHQLSLEDFSLSTGRSTIRGFISMSFENPKAFQHFEEEVDLHAQLALSNVHMGDIAWFAPGLKGLESSFRIRGKIKGRLNDLKADGLRILFGSVTQLDGRLHLKGLPDIQNTHMDIDLDRMVTNGYDLERIPLPPFPEQRYVQVPAELKRLGVLKFNGHFDGYLRDFNAFGQLQTGLGSASLDMHMVQPAKGLPYYEGSLDLKKFQAGALTGNQLGLGMVSASGEIRGEGFSGEDFFAAFDGGVSLLEINGYTYQGLVVNADVGPGVFTGRVLVDDPNAKLDFNGRIDFSQEKPSFDFIARLSEVDLGRLNVIALDSSSSLSTNIYINASGDEPDNIMGSLRVDNTRFSLGSREYQMDELTLSSELLPEGKTLSLHSDFIDADVDGQYRFVPLFQHLGNQLAAINPSSGLERIEILDSLPQNFTFSVHLKETAALTDLFVPGLSIHPNSIAYGQYNSEARDIRLNVRSGKVQWKQWELDSWTLRADTRNDSLTVKTRVAHVRMSDSLQLDRFMGRIQWFRDTLAFDLGFSNETDKLNALSLHGTTRLGDSLGLPVEFSKSYGYYQDGLWRLQDGAFVLLGADRLAFRDFKVESERHKLPLLSISGAAGLNEKEKLDISFADFPVELLGEFIPGGGLEPSGNLSGTLSLYRLFSEEMPLMTSNLRVDHLSMNGMALGKLSVDSRFGAEGKVLEIGALLQKDGVDLLKISKSKVRPFEPEQLLDIEAKIEGLPLEAIKPFGGDLFKSLSGKASGRLLVKGSGDNPQINGALYLTKPQMNLAFLNSPMKLDLKGEPILFTSHSIILPDIRITDSKEGSAHLIGVLFHRNFADLDMRLNLDRIKNFQAMATTVKDNEQFYGKAVVTSQDLVPKGNGRAVEISGPLNDLYIKANLEVGAGTSINLPISGGATAQENNFVRFVDRDSMQIKGKLGGSQDKAAQVDEGNLTIELDLRTTAEAEYRVIFDETVGDVLTARGTSDHLAITLDMKDRFEMDGTFTIAKGDYLFTLSNLVNKPFIIKPGSFVTWSGDPLEAQINATAIHPARASLYPLVSPFTSDPAQAERYRRASRIFCELNLTDRLIDPRIGFGLSLPDEDESTRALVRSVMNSEEEVNRQVFSLLIINSFLPPESIGSGGLGGGALAASGLGSNSLSLLSGQLNNWLGKITKDVNINLDYQAGEQNRAERVMVGLQTQLFDNRVIIDTDLGVGGGDQSQADNTNTVVGNVNVEVKATEDGRLRIRAFNRSNEYNLLKNSVPYTQGVGLSYQREFDAWSDLFRPSKTKDSLKVRPPDGTEKQETEQQPELINDSDPEYLQQQKGAFDGDGNAPTPPPNPTPPKGILVPDPTDME